jgi:nickel-dependent lactate racemase
VRRKVPAGSPVRLAYGRSGLQLRLPVEADVIEPSHQEPLADPAGAIRRAFLEPEVGPSLPEMVPRGARLGVSVCDVTRPFPSALVLPVLLDLLPGAEVTLFVATGTHRACTPDELRAMIGDDVLDRVHVHQHDAFDPAAHTALGLIPGTGTPAAIDAAFLAQDVRVTLGFIEPHFFAGFSGGPKMVAPGLASLETVLELHSAERLGDPRAAFGILAGNPVHEAIAATTAMVDVAFALDVTLDADHRITSIHAGRPFEAHARGCELVRRTSMEAVSEPYDVVLTTNSGYPLDQNLYQTIKGICAAAGIVRGGGTIVVASECADGLPAHGRYGSLLARYGSATAYLDDLRAGRLRTHDQWQVQKQALVLEDVRVLVHADGLSADQLRAAWFEPADDLDAALRSALSDAGPGARLAVLPEGPQTIAYVAEPLAGASAIG